MQAGYVQRHCHGREPARDSRRHPAKQKLSPVPRETEERGGAEVASQVECSPTVTDSQPNES